jgi:hypothetical protein
MGSKKRLPQMAGGSASALSLSRPAQASLTLRPAGSLSRPQATFVTRLQPMRLPTRAARQLMIRAFGAHCQLQTRAVQQAAVNRWPASKAQHQASNFRIVGRGRGF